MPSHPWPPPANLSRLPSAGEQDRARRTIVRPPISVATVSEGVECHEVENRDVGVARGRRGRGAGGQMSAGGPAGPG
jgi:hypothetical protein